MNATSLATSLLGRRVRLSEPRPARKRPRESSSRFTSTRRGHECGPVTHGDRLWRYSPG